MQKYSPLILYALMGVSGFSNLEGVQEQNEPLSRASRGETDLTRPRKTSLAISGEYLYFKAIEDGLKYAQKTPQTPTYQPKSSPLDQGFSYHSAFRAGIGYTLPKESWAMRASYMRYHSNTGTVHASSSNFGILAVLALPTYGIDQNQLVDRAEGNWRLRLDSVDLDLQIPLHMSRRFLFSAAGGVKAGFVDQKIDVKYSGFEILQPIANTPLHVRGKNNMWGVGPFLSLDGKFCFAEHFGLFFKASIAALTGHFELKTRYSSFLNAPSNARLEVDESQWRVSLVEQFQAGIDLKWTHFELGAGWEVQVWTKQLRLNLFDSFIQPSNGEDLTLYGPYAKIAFYF